MELLFLFCSFVLLNRGGASEINSGKKRKPGFFLLAKFSEKNPAKMKFCTPLLLCHVRSPVPQLRLAGGRQPFYGSAHHHRNENNIMEILAAGLVVKLLQEMNHHHGR
ncbi:hypothetical protein CEXT_244401 [Caerostris extrusa]|uniref:Secreted protein n=1 Tax=Caerostris extrusa TaxID=172846 RepID=A0AAV4XL97_CAEEX|nr:hypothetical protein CEXT_244401 [Caerostris extrusa]